MSTYFISDIHLDANSNATAQLLLNFLNTTGQTADAIYILGDLFAIWFGDDINPDYAQRLIQTLQNLSKQNIPVYFMRGNRDFLVGQKFCSVSGCKLLPDPCVVNLYGQNVLLTHGDMLCTADRSYIKFRKFVQNPIIKFLFLSLPKSLRIKIGNLVKTTANKNKPPINPAIYDAVPAVIDTWMNKFNTTILIHGHTHNPAIHQQKFGTRIVLGDWTERAAKILVSRTSKDYKIIDLVQNT